MENSRLIILAGPNGAGKSTFAENKDLSFIYKLGIESFDYDLEFKKLYNKYLSIMTKQVEENIISSTKNIFEHQANNSLKNNTHFSFQTNYDKPYTDKWRIKFSEAGFKTELYFLYVDSIDICKERVAKRVKEGGHFVTNEEIKIRYNNG